MDRPFSLRSDLAAEAHERLQKDEGEPDGIAFEEETHDAYALGRLRVFNENGARLLGKPEGNYLTFSFGRPFLLSDEERAQLSSAIGRELLRLMRGKNVDFSRGPLMAAGLGNRRMAVDAIGPAVISKVTVTNHLRTLDPPLFSKLGMHALAAFCPGVLGDTGVESADAVHALCRLLRPCALIVVDALAAGSRSRLARAVQISDAGISPGSGVGNDRPALCEERFGVPVFSLGVPTVVDLSTLVYEMAENAGVDRSALPPAFQREADGGGSFFVAPKDIDAAVEALGDLLAAAIDEAMRNV